MDSKIATETGQMLDDRVILAAQNILKREFPEVNGFQPSVLSKGDITFEAYKNNMVQILFKGSSKCGHWISISTLNLKPGCVNVYNSLNLDLDLDVTNQIPWVLNFPPCRGPGGSIPTGNIASLVSSNCPLWEERRGRVV